MSIELLFSYFAAKARRHANHEVHTPRRLKMLLGLRADGINNLTEATRTLSSDLELPWPSFPS